MSWIIDNNRPVYIQLVEQLKFKIISGEFKAGQKIDSVRVLAQDAQVNPNTMQKALAELERQNLVFSKRTSGRFVTDNEELIKSCLLYTSININIFIFIRKLYSI